MTALKPLKEHDPYIQLVFRFQASKKAINYRIAGYLILGCHWEGFRVHAMYEKCESSTLTLQVHVLKRC
jgi:hypothetical protein